MVKEVQLEALLSHLSKHGPTDEMDLRNEYGVATIEQAAREQLIETSTTRIPGRLEWMKS